MFKIGSVIPAKPALARSGTGIQKNLTQVMSNKKIGLINSLLITISSEVFNV